ncbi:unnamed protein product [Spirodela intermedia]|uniref:Uncharacterized protein n=1 Tax=Spirodela intermedia TaxID=51605 RepID=A0A7I8K7J6_SPIIN|nr:unnamed protein product [Spirodela intermedia]
MRPGPPRVGQPLGGAADGINMPWPCGGSPLWRGRRRMQAGGA